MHPDDAYRAGRRLEDDSAEAAGSGWRFVLPVVVRLNDMDAFGHVNNAVYLTYCEMARTAYLRLVAGLGAPAGLDMILARAELDYRAPVTFGDNLRVLVRAAAVGSKSFTLEYRLLVTEDGADRVVCEGRSVLVGYDYTTRRSIVVPDALVVAFEAFEGRPLRR